MHYYGGVSHLHQQTHVITSKWFSLFPCSVSLAIHTIHFVPNQPHIRHWISAKVNRVMEQQGVRFNDFESLKNANAFPGS